MPDKNNNIYVTGNEFQLPSLNPIDRAKTQQWMVKSGRVLNIQPEKPMKLDKEET